MKQFLVGGDPPYAAVFDLDGTLVDSVGDIAAAANWVLAKRGMPELSVQQVNERIGLPAAALFEGTPLANEREKAVIEFRARLAEIAGEFSSVFPGVVRVLETLSAGGWRLGVATNKPTPLARLALDRAGLGTWFTTVHGADAGPPKPDPATVVSCLRVLECRAGLMIGDTRMDIEAGRAAGLVTVAVACGSHSVDEILKSEPDVIFLSMSEFAESLA